MSNRKAEKAFYVPSSESKYKRYIEEFESYVPHVMLSNSLCS